MGGLFTIDRPETLAPAINRLLAVPELRVEMASNGRRRVLDEYTYTLNAERYTSFYAGA